MKWILLVISLPTENSSARMRIWRALKALGAAALRDGVYLLPNLDSCRKGFNAVMVDASEAGGVVYLLDVDNLDDSAFLALFSREQEFASLLADIAQAEGKLSEIDSVSDALKPIRKLRKTFTALVEIDFFPGEAQKQVDSALQALELTVNRLLSPDEPHDIESAILSLQIQDYQNRIWATRRRPWVDRLACAWLVQRFIDTKAKILWLETPADCPQEAVGFDFDGATFSHVGAMVTFEVLLMSFSLEQPALKRIGALVHYLDVGGIQPPEAMGVESILTGLRAAIPDDDALLMASHAVFDGLLASFSQSN